MKVDFGKNIREIRLSLKLNQAQFGEKIGVSRSTINHWENNEALPNLYTLKKIKEVFGISYDEIIEGM